MERFYHTVRKCNCQLEEAALPYGLLLSRHAAVPRLQIKVALGIALRLCVEAKRVVFTPLLSDDRVPIVSTDTDR